MKLVLIVAMTVALTGCFTETEITANTGEGGVRVSNGYTSMTALEVVLDSGLVCVVAYADGGGAGVTCDWEGPRQ